ncbi:MAG TPA: hypothetical protein VLQ93_10505 [Myxococcaceae bacterium]|nr:hypothetical protein [Myxococcaceae bacterium]
MMGHRKSLAVAGAALATMLLGGEASARVRSNTQVRLPNNLYLADVTGDGLSDFIAVKDDKILVTRTNYEAHGYLYGNTGGSNIKRLFTGHFWDKNKENICAILANGSTKCYGASPDNSALWWGLTQGTFVADDEHALVGDFNGDGYDDILVYKPAAGTFRMYTRLSTGFFGLMPGFTLGNLSNPDSFKNMQIRVGEFNTGASPRRDDLLIYNPSTRQIGRYDAAVNSSGQYTFWWAFWTNGGMVATNEEVTVANVDGDSSDDVVLHSTTGGYRFARMVYSGGGLPAITNVSAGQLSSSSNASLYWGRFKQIAGEPGANRDDALVNSGSYFIRTDARWNGSEYTYWWAYTQYVLNMDQDQDGDGILTLHELGGYDTNANGISDVPLHSYGASPFVKDIFVEVDYMQAGTGETESHIMKPEAVNLAVAEMARFGINLHIFISNSVAHTTNLGNPGFDWARDFDPIKNANFSTSRRPFFHYCLFGHSYSGGTSSGLSRGIPASDFLVTLGDWTNNTGTVQQQAGTFLHELGHNLGLQHGGTQGTNYKPNFLSIMNYAYQTVGILKNGTRQFLYSELGTNALNESYLNEWTGVTASTNGNTFRTYVRSRNAYFDLNKAIDYNGDGYYSSSVAVDVNVDNTKTTLYGSPNEYTSIVYTGGSVGSAAGTSLSLQQEPQLVSELKMEEELDYETWRREVVPMEKLLPALDLRPHRKPLRTHQPLQVWPEWNDLK